MVCFTSVLFKVLFSFVFHIFHYYGVVLFCFLLFFIYFIFRGCFCFVFFCYSFFSFLGGVFVCFLLFFIYFIIRGCFCFVLFCFVLVVCFFTVFFYFILFLCVIELCTSAKIYKQYRYLNPVSLTLITIYTCKYFNQWCNDWQVGWVNPNTVKLVFATSPIST